MNLHSFDMNLLRVLDALLQEQSTVLAGERIGLSQPAVSSALGRLRLAFEDPLFVRQGQRIVPTEFAKQLEIPLRDVLDKLEEIVSSTSEFDPASVSRNFIISGSDFFAEVLIPSLSKYVSEIAPDVIIQLVDLVPDNYVGTLQNHEIDLALVPHMSFPGWIDSQKVFTSDFVMIARQKHPQLSEINDECTAQIPMDLFCELQHVAFSPEGKTRAMVDHALEKHGRRRQVRLTMPVFGGICNVVADSDLVAVLPRQVATRMAQKLGLSIYEPPVKIAAVDIEMIWHRRNTRNAAHTWLRNVISEILSPISL